VLVGVMTLTAQGNGQFSYQSEFRGIAGTQLPVQNVEELTWCNETLEAYRIAACSDYPATDLTPMQSINLRTGNTTPAVHWTPQDRVTDCSQHALVPVDSATGGEVDLWYRNPTIQIPWQRYAQYVQILFGVIHGEGGIGIVNGHIVRIPPHNPEYRLFSQISHGLAEVARGFGARQAIANSAIPEVGRTIDKAGLEMMLKGLQLAEGAVRDAIQASNRQ